MIPTIDITTEHIKAKYNVSEKLAHDIIKLILEDYSSKEE